MNPNVSIIIPVYNVEKHIVKCIESVMSQTIDHSIVECIIVNDCTPDNSMDIIGELTRDYQTNNGKMSFRIINHTENKGVSTSRNDGIDAATGDFVFFIDSDDYLYPECLQTLYEAHIKYSNADLIIGNAYNEILNTNVFDISKDRVVNNLNYLFQGTLAHYTVWNMLIRRDMLNKYDLRFKSNLSATEDDLALNTMAKGGQKKLLLQEQAQQTLGLGKVNRTEMEKIRTKAAEDLPASDVIYVPNTASVTDISQSAHKLIPVRNVLYLVQKHYRLLTIQFQMGLQQAVKVFCQEFRQTLILKVHKQNLVPSLS